MSRSGAAKSKPIRCAIYTRKSSDEGLEQDFNSLDAQRDAAESYIASQRAEGWTCIPARYDDGGFTGGNLDRPGVQRLMADIEAGLIDWWIDRIARVGAVHSVGTSGRYLTGGWHA